MIFFCCIGFEGLIAFFTKGGPLEMYNNPVAGKIVEGLRVRSSKGKTGTIAVWWDGSFHAKWDEGFSEPLFSSMGTPQAIVGLEIVES